MTCPPPTHGPQLLPNVRLTVDEIKIGCVDNLGPTAVRELQAKLPYMLAALGPICSNDVRDISNSTFRAEQPQFRQLVISGSSTAPSLASKTIVYPYLAHLTTSELYQQCGSQGPSVRGPTIPRHPIPDPRIWGSRKG